MSNELTEPHDLKGRMEVTGAQVVKKLRKIVQPERKRGTWLRHLSDKRLVEVFHRLRLGQPAGHIIDIAQKEWGMMQKSSKKSLTRALTKFRTQALGEISVEKTDPKISEKEKRNISDKAKRVVEKLDALGRLGWLIDVQTDRLILQHDVEKKSGMPLKSTERTVKELGVLLNMLAGRQIELGILDSKPSEFNLNIKHRFDGLLQNTVGDGGVAMIEATNTFLEQAEQAALTLEIGDGGVYVLKKGDEHAESESSSG